MNKIYLIIGFIIMVAAQWFVPGQMIVEQESVLTEGTAYKFKTRPIDPSDPLRGKYITLNFEMQKAFTKDSTINYGDALYVCLKNDADGFAKATIASKEKLDNKLDYIKVEANYYFQDTISFRVPFNTFYMEESKAYPAETLVRQANRDSILNNCYGLVYVKDDRAVLENVLINDEPIKDYVERHIKENTER
ncbi:hypothetical protein SCB49_08513 [unidentified eubacterium SCB49]|nr:hypothetical protein SCB49_08513 [unidentified eubacterium SCB49]